MGLLNEIVEKLLKNFLSLKEDDWVEWIAQPNDWQDDCDKFNGCYFIVKQMPKYPQHPRCQCRLEKIAKPIPYITAKTTCDIRKFTEYIFSDKYDDGKKELFESWGYTIEDSEYLQQLYTSQAIQKYCDGQYQYVGVNDHSAKISITITLTNQDGVEQHINTIWKLGQKGTIDLLHLIPDIVIKEKVMDKYQNNALVEEMDAIILLNDSYADQGLFKGYIGAVMSNFIEKYGFVVADFYNPFTGKSIQPVIEIKKEDFRVISGSLADQKLVKEFKDLFRK